LKVFGKFEGMGFKKCVVGGVGFFESAWVFKCAWKVREDGQSSRVYEGIFKGLCRVGLCKVRGGAAMALNVLGKFKVMWVGKFLESSRVWAGKVLGKLEGV
jgi:hypothetical protein